MSLYQKTTNSQSTKDNIYHSLLNTHECFCDCTEWTWRSCRGNVFFTLIKVSVQGLILIFTYVPATNQHLIPNAGCAQDLLLHIQVWTDGAAWLVGRDIQPQDGNSNYSKVLLKAAWNECLRRKEVHSHIQKPDESPWKVNLSSHTMTT